MLRKIMLFLLVLVLFFSKGILYAEDSIQIKVAWWGSQVRHDKTLAVIELFEKRFPNVDIQPIYTGWREYWDTMAIYAARGDLPDIMQHDYKYFNYYNDYNILLNLDNYIDNIIKLHDVDDSLLNTARIDNKLYGIPAGLNTYTILYDPDKFKEAGLKEPSYDWTWEEYKEICRKLHSRLGIYADTSLPMATRNITGLEHYVRQHGQTLVTDSGKKLGFTEDLFVEFYDMDLELTQQRIFAPGELRLENNTMENDLLVSGKAVMAAYWTNQIVAISEALGKPLKMLPFPQAKGQVQTGYYLKPSMYWTITKNSKHPEYAAKFIDFLINDPTANKILNADRGIPISTKVRTLLKPVLSETERTILEFVRYISANFSIIEPPQPAQYNKMIEILEEEHFKILNGSQSSQKAYHEFKRKIENILNSD